MLTDLDGRFLSWVLDEMTLDRMRQVQKRIEEEISWREKAVWGATVGANREGVRG